MASPMLHAPKVYCIIGSLEILGPQLLSQASALEEASYFKEETLSDLCI